MTDSDDSDLDPRVSPSRQISLTRPPKLSSDLARYYPYEDEEQDIIKQAMRDMLAQHEEGITPTELLASFRTFIDATTGEVDAKIIDGDVVLQCDVAELELADGEDSSVDISVSISDPED